MPEASEIADLRARHADLSERQAQLEGRATEARSNLDALREGLAEYDCTTLEELEAKIEQERAAVADAQVVAEASLSQIEARVRDADSA